MAQARQNPAIPKSAQFDPNALVRPAGAPPLPVPQAPAPPLDLQPEAPPIGTDPGAELVQGNPQAVGLAGPPTASAALDQLLGPVGTPAAPGAPVAAPAPAPGAPAPMRLASKALDPVLGAPAMPGSPHAGTAPPSVPELEANESAGKSTAELQASVYQNERDQARAPLDADARARSAYAEEVDRRLQEAAAAKAAAETAWQQATAQPVDANRFRDNLGLVGWVAALVGGFAGGLAGKPEVMMGLIERKVNDDIRLQLNEKDSRVKRLEVLFGDRQAALNAVKSEKFQAIRESMQAAGMLGAYDQQTRSGLAGLSDAAELQARTAEAAGKQSLLQTYQTARAKAQGEAEGKRMGSGAGGRSAAPGAQGVQDDLLKRYGVDRKRWDKFSERASQFDAADVQLDETERTVDELLAGGDTPGYLESLGVENPLPDSPDASRFKQAVLPLFMKYKHAMTGAAASVKEAEQIMRAQFGNMRPSEIKARLGQMRAELKQGRKSLYTQDPGSYAVWQQTTPNVARGEENLGTYE